MAVITISRHLGSLGSITAQKASVRLGYRLVGRELIDQAALRSGSPEAALADIDELNLLGVNPSLAAMQAYIVAVKSVVEELASEGNIVIVGRGGQVILQDHPGVVRILMTAPLELRAQRIAERQSIPLSAARAQVEASDRHRRLFLKRFYNIKWDDPDLYDLVINTVHMSADAATGIICELASSV